MKKKEIFWPIFLALVSAALGYGASYLSFNRQNKAATKTILNDNLNKIMDIEMQYPFVVDDDFISRWNKDEVYSNDSITRYQMYCNYIFNFTQDIFTYYDYDFEKAEKYVDITVLLSPHKGWWNATEPNNSSSYPKKMVDLINKILK